MALTLHLIEQAALNFLNHQTTPVTLYQYLDNIGILDIGKKLLSEIPNKYVGKQNLLETS